MSYPGTFPYGSGHQQVLDSSCVSLKVRQQPQSALVTLDGKEKSRKPIDPPPIVEIKVRPDVDPFKHYLVSPYFFMYATLLPHDPNNPHADEQAEQVPQRQSGYMLGQLCSSLHRLKDVDNQDGGFFIFGDLSVRKIGWHKLRFALYDVSKAAENAAFIKDVVSEPFQVVAAKDFHGMEESSYLSRAFSDQGVRLRLRKEPRSIASAHRRGLSQKFSPPQAQKPQASQEPYAQAGQNDRYVDSARPLKRQRSDSDFAENVYPPTQMPRTSYSGYGGASLSQSFPQFKQDPQERMPMGYGDQSLGYNIRGTSAYPPPLSSISGYQNPLQQPGPSPLPTNTTLGNISEHGPPSTASVPRPMSSYYGSAATGTNYGSYSGNYQTPSGGQYGSTSRTSSDSYPNLLGLQTPTSMTDIAALPSGHETNYMPSTSSAMSVGAGAGAHTPVQSQQQPHDYSALSGGYTHAPATYVQSSPTYPSAPAAQPHHAHHSSLDHVPYSSALPGGQVPASTSMLLGEGMPQNFYQHDEASYPTPTHVKQQPPWG